MNATDMPAAPADDPLALTRRDLLLASAATAATAPAADAAPAGQTSQTSQTSQWPAPGEQPLHRLTLTVNGRRHTVDIDTRTTLLDLLREGLRLNGSKKGCDHGQCGACTVVADGRRINACLSLALLHEGGSVTTIEGLGRPGALHPMQAAFVQHDGYQCGYCTPGQICSAVAMLDELRAGIPSHVSADLNARPRLSPEELRERMSGNICRCGAYSNIVDAITEVAGAKP